MKNKATQSKAWATVQIARHPERPQFLDYVSEIFTEFDALHGDRLYGDDGAMIGGLARFDGQPVMVVGQHRGRSTREKLQHNFGMCNPEGYRKSQRLLDMAERFNLPVFTFIDTMGAYPGVGAEERGQAEAIATSLAQLSNLKVPVIATVLGEGGSGGALGIGVRRHYCLRYSPAFNENFRQWRPAKRLLLGHDHHGRPEYRAVLRLFFHDQRTSP